jgi:hypothetical protein
LCVCVFVWLCITGVAPLLPWLPPLLLPLFSGERTFFR